ncbi:MAG: hypothetical protein NTW11_01760 [Candidatus Staskawiczbacteria bacterium]|nr:hypothetical protein [Candidatus Staskawiczbacteria bacterium]
MFQVLQNNKNNSGFLLLEIIISIAIIVIAFVSLIGVAFLAINTSSSVQKQTQADSLVREEFEAVRNFRDGTTWATNGLGIINTGSANPYHAVINANKWTLVAGVETTGIFTRSVVIDKVYRDGSGNISTSGTLDADTIKVTVTVSYTGKTIQDMSYFTNWKQ